ncbi:MAG: hypothetical protein NTX73_07775 [Rhodobacterales bacterium]|nr:hypothetical protein [Rhodobacterales bacterium]
MMFKGSAMGLSVALFALTTGMAMAQDDGSLADDPAVDMVPDGIDDGTGFTKCNDMPEVDGTFDINDDGDGDDVGTGAGDGWITIDPIETVFQEVVVDEGVVYEDLAVSGWPDVPGDEGSVPPESECGECVYAMGDGPNFVEAGGPVLENARDDISSSHRFVSDWEPFAQRPERPDFCVVTKLDLGWLCPDNRQ